MYPEEAEAEEEEARRAAEEQKAEEEEARRAAGEEGAGQGDGGVATQRASGPEAEKGLVSMDDVPAADMDETEESDDSRKAGDDADDGTP